MFSVDGEVVVQAEALGHVADLLLELLRLRARSRWPATHALSFGRIE